MSTTAQLAQGGNVVGQNTALTQPRPPVKLGFWDRINERYLWGAMVGLIILGLGALTIYIINLFHAFIGTSHASAGSYTYTSTINPTFWVWFVITMILAVGLPFAIYGLANLLDFFPEVSSAAGGAVVAAILIGSSLFFLTGPMQKGDLAAHANQWLQTNLHTTYDVTNDIQWQNRFTEKITALTIDGAQVNFYLSLVDNTILIRPADK